MVYKRSVKGRSGWRFIFRDAGQTISINDYKPIKISRASRGYGPHKAGGVKRYNKEAFEKKKQQILDKSLEEFKAGRYIYADVFVRLCKLHGVKLTKSVSFQCRYMDQMDISIRTIRHKNSRGDFRRASFNGVFSAVEFLIARTME